MFIYNTVMNITEKHQWTSSYYNWATFAIHIGVLIIYYIIFIVKKSTSDDEAMEHCILNHFLAYLTSNELYKHNVNISSSLFHLDS